MSTRDRTFDGVLRLATGDDARDAARDAALDPSLARAAQLLREEVPMRDDWRRAVLRDIAQAPAPRHPLHRRIRIRPLVAAAACLACIGLGAAAGLSLDAPPQMPRDHVAFAIVAPGAARVNLVGDFNGWDARATPMRPSADGRTWLVDLPLAPGRHVYAYVVDGDVIADPAAPRTAGDDFGVPSSVVLVSRPSA